VPLGRVGSDRRGQGENCTDPTTAQLYGRIPRERHLESGDGCCKAPGSAGADASHIAGSLLALPRNQRPHRAVEAEHERGEDDAPRFDVGAEALARLVDGSCGGAGCTLPAGSVRSQSVHGAPNGAKRGLKMANATLAANPSARC
jgi:hypothetical protein